MSEGVHYAVRDGIGVISINHPPDNALGAQVRAGLIECLEQGQADAGAKGLLLTGEGRTFSTGIPIAELAERPQPPPLEAVVRAFENSDKLVVAAVHGTVLGAGLELALGCHYRVALGRSVFRLPEVTLGLIPGAGGTQRLPRLIGTEAALEMIAGSNPIKAGRAQQYGLVDVVVDNNLLAGATLVVKRLVKHQAELHRAGERQAESASDALFEDFEQRLASQGGDSHAQSEAQASAIQAVRAAMELPFEEGLARERELLAELMRSPQVTERLQQLLAEGREVSDL